VKKRKKRERMLIWARGWVPTGAGLDGVDLEEEDEDAGQMGHVPG